MDDDVIITGSETAIMAKMFRENERFVDMKRYVNPMIHRKHEDGAERY